MVQPKKGRGEVTDQIGWAHNGVPFPPSPLQEDALAEVPHGSQVISVCDEHTIDTIHWGGGKPSLYRVNLPRQVLE